MLEKHLWNSFLLYLVVEILLTCTWNKVLYKRGALKNFSKFSDKHKEHSPGGVLSKDVLKNFDRKNIFAGVSFLTKLQFGNLKPAQAAAGDSL